MRVQKEKAGQFPAILIPDENGKTHSITPTDEALSQTEAYGLADVICLFLDGDVNIFNAKDVIEDIIEECKCMENSTNTYRENLDLLKKYILEELKIASEANLKYSDEFDFAHTCIKNIAVKVPNQLHLKWCLLVALSWGEWVVDEKLEKDILEFEDFIKELALLKSLSDMKNAIATQKRKMKKQCISAPVSVVYDLLESGVKEYSKYNADTSPIDCLNQLCANCEPWTILRESITDTFLDPEE